MGVGVLYLVGGWYERIIPMLYHARHQIFCEGFFWCVEVAHNGGAVPPSQYLNGVSSNGIK